MWINNWEIQRDFYIKLIGIDILEASESSRTVQNMEQFSTPHKTPTRSVLKEINANDSLVSIFLAEHFFEKPIDVFFSELRSLCERFEMSHNQYFWSKILDADWLFGKNVLKLTDLQIRQCNLSKSRENALNLQQFELCDKYVKRTGRRACLELFCHFFSFNCLEIAISSHRVHATFHVAAYSRAICLWKRESLASQPIFHD